jgi:hypothetical protein
MNTINVRTDIPAFLNAQGLTGYGAEVGVQRGRHSQKILEIWVGKKLYCIDAWVYSRGKCWMKEATSRLTQYVDKGLCELIKKFSVEAAPTFVDGFFDFIYIDACHHYEQVRDDLAVWYPKVKSGGLFAGHDYREDGIYRNDYEYGVKTAVDDHCKKYGLDLHVTDEGDMSTWWLIKP